MYDQLKYKISGEISADDSLAYIDDPFVLNENTGNLLLNFNADDNSLKGTFAFTAEVTDQGKFRIYSQKHMHIFIER